jgi:hypothetical protein
MKYEGLLTVTTKPAFDTHQLFEEDSVPWG